MKYIFTLGSPDIGGGTNVIFEHASYLANKGNEVYIVNERKIKQEEYNWHSKAHVLKFVTYDEIKNMTFDVAIATWWMTVYDLYRINAVDYIYFVQSIESRFYKEHEIAVKFLAELTYCLDLKIITEATWIKEYLEEKYGLVVELVLNGIRKDIFNVSNEKLDKKGLRILVEGPVNVDFKNVPKTIELVKESEADEVWLLTSSDIKEYKGVDKVFSRIPPSECADIYRSCDAIVKLSYVEGMFGPPLEMFHCGGTAIVYNVSGHDEYIKDGYNGFVVKADDEEGVVEAINKLKDKKILGKLKENAIITAGKWPSWDESSEAFYTAINKLSNLKKVNKKVLEHKSKLYFEIYRNYELKQEKFVTVMGRSIKRRSQYLYNFLKKLRDKFK